MSPHRTPGEVVPDGPTPLETGPAKACKGCGAKAVAKMQKSISAEQGRLYDWYPVGRSDDSPLPAPRACTPRARVRIGWFRRCSTPGEHLHERCRVCGLEWLTAFADGGG